MDIYDLLHQDRIWITNEGKAIRINRMDISHAVNLKSWLERRALGIQIAAFACAQKYLMWLNGEMAIECMEQAIDEEFEPSPLEWVQSMPLYKAVAKRAKKIEKLQVRISA